MIPTASAELTCLCGAIKEPGDLLASSEIPSTTLMCHCTSCRLATGTLGVSFPYLKGPPSQATISKLSAYHSSNSVTRYFCSQCGCHCFCQHHGREQWSCIGGIIEQSSRSKTNGEIWPENTIKILRHDYIDDTRDGGIVPFQLNLGGRLVPTWSGEPDRDHPDAFNLSHSQVLTMLRSAEEQQQHNKVARPKKESYLTAECHCKGVSLKIKRANFHLGDMQRNVAPDPTRYNTFPCACRSCRLSTSDSMMAFAGVPPENVFNGRKEVSTVAKSRSGSESESESRVLYDRIVFGDAACDPESNPGQTLKHYQSSPEVYRSFCGQCGASVFYWNRNRAEEIDLAVGILHSQDGALARNWLQWDWAQCSFVEECVNKELADGWRASKNLIASLEVKNS